MHSGPVRAGTGISIRGHFGDVSPAPGGTARQGHRSGEATQLATEVATEGTGISLTEIAPSETGLTPIPDGTGISRGPAANALLGQAIQQSGI
jgi:hypothetical protein